MLLLSPSPFPALPPPHLTVWLWPLQQVPLSMHLHQAFPRPITVPVSHPVSNPKAFVRISHLPFLSVLFGLCEDHQVSCHWNPLRFSWLCKFFFLWLPDRMKNTLPVHQHWIASTLWRNKRLRNDLKLWYESPTLSLLYHQVPRSPLQNASSATGFWCGCPTTCGRSECSAPNAEGTSQEGIFTARQELDIDRNCLMITETLRCSSSECKGSYLSSGNTTLDQLDLPHWLSWHASELLSTLIWSIYEILFKL